MNEWRPEGWKNPYPDINAGFPTNDFIYSEYDLFDAHEAGADAILAALKEQSTRVDTGVEKGIINLPFHGGSRGFVVFIPDEKA